jgi:hypothetical protein
MPVRRAHISIVSKRTEFFFARLSRGQTPAAARPNSATIAKILTSRFETIDHFANGLPGLRSKVFPPPGE